MLLSIYLKPGLNPNGKFHSLRATGENGLLLQIEVHLHLC
jgi:hypothetical protein